MPYFRHRSFVFAPASASLSTPMICSSVNRRLFIRLLPDEQTLLHSGTNLGEQTTLTRVTTFVRTGAGEWSYALEFSTAQETTLFSTHNNRDVLETNSRSEEKKDK